MLGAKHRGGIAVAIHGEWQSTDGLGTVCQSNFVVRGYFDIGGGGGGGGGV